MAGRGDAHAVTALWQEALEAPGHTGPPVWAHGDLSPGNVLVDGGRLAAVIDFNCAGVGDPAVDLIVAWNLLPAEVRGLFREAVAADGAQWARGRSWALSISLIQLAVLRGHQTGARGELTACAQGDPGRAGPTGAVMRPGPDAVGRAGPVRGPARACVTRPRTPSPGRRCRACPSTAWPSWRGPPSPGPGR
ncbi:phosphotransferase [Streptomyces sp. GD-15H]